jgi:Uma2 family endonuclease
MSTLANLVGRNLRNLSVEDFHALIDRGILKPEDRVELLGGRLHEMNPVKSDTAAQVRKLFKRIDKAAEHYNRDRNRDELVIVRQEAPLVLKDNSEPLPDIALVGMDKSMAPMDDMDDCYVDANPTAEDTLLIIEVSNTTLRRDREEKLPHYAASGVPEVWILDMDSRTVTVYHTPVGDKYTQEIAVRSGAITPLQLPGLLLAVDELLVRPVRARGGSIRRK